MQSKLLSHKLTRRPSVSENSNEAVPASKQKPLVHMHDLPLNARLPLAILRLSSQGDRLPLPHRHVIDVLSRILDSGNEREHRLASLNAWNEVVLTNTYHELDVRGSGSETLSADEADLIRALNQAQNDTLNVNDAALSSLMDRSARIRFRDAGRHMMSGSVTNSTPTGGNEYSSPSVLECQHLSIAESVVINMLRLWVRSGVMRLDGAIAVRVMSAHLGVHPLGELLCSLLSRTSRSAYRKFDARCICCPEVSPDEAMTLSGLAAVESGAHSHYQKSLLNWLPTLWAKSAFTLTIENAKLLPSAGLSLPQRDWDYATMIPRQPLFDSVERTTQMIH